MTPGFLLPAHPALVVLALVVLGGAWGLRRWDPNLARAWGWIGLAGALLLAPALLQSGGIPSPAASLAVEAPWQEVGDPADGNPVLRDVTFQIQPWLLFLREEMRHGRLPLWNPHQFAGAPFWANGQSAPLFPLHLLFVLLPLQVGFVLLPWLRFLVAGLGAWKLARELGLEPPGALAAALVFPLSGMSVSFLLFPMGNALALVPWVLWSVERLARGRSNFAGVVPLACTGGLQLLGGHPETVIHTVLLSALYLLVRGGAPTGLGLGTWLGTWLRFAGGWALAVGLAAVHWVPLAFHVLQSSKWQEAGTGASLAWSEAGGFLLRLVLPQLYGHPAHGTWWGPFNYSATAVYLGALAWPLAFAGLRELDRRWTAVLAVTGVSLVVAYHLPGIYDLVQSLPLLGRVAHHRLIFGVELGGALLMGRGLDRFAVGKGPGKDPDKDPDKDPGQGLRPALAGALVVVGMLAAAWLAFGEAWARHHQTAIQLRWTLWVGALAVSLPVLWALSRRLAPGVRNRLAGGLLAVLVLDLLLAHGAINPALPLDRLYPETGAVQRLRELGADAPDAHRLVGVGGTLRPNAALVYGFYDVRGDDPVKAARFERLYRRLAEGSAVYFQPVTRWDRELLDALAVRWVIGPPGGEPPGSAPPGDGQRGDGQRRDWQRVYDGPDARIWARPGALSRVRTLEGEPVPVLHAEPGRWEIDPGAAREVVIAETWDEGWRVELAPRASGDLPARDLPSGDLPAEAPARTPEVRETEEGWMRVVVPADSRRLVLRYRAPGLPVGMWISTLALAIAVGMVFVSARRRRSAIIPSG